MAASLDYNASLSVRVRVFVDFWNFHISMQQRGFYADSYSVDWRELGPCLARAAGHIVNPDRPASYQGMNVYGSYDDASPRDVPLLNWMRNTVGKFPGVSTVMVPRQRRREGPKCPSCHQAVLFCPDPQCGADMRGTEEKGIDTRIATDLISLAWDGNYEVAVLVSSDRDFVPVVEFLGKRGIKVVHGAFLPAAAELTQACWASINIPEMRQQFRRK